MNRLKQIKAAYIGISAGMMAVGVVLMCFPKLSLMTVCYLLGGCLTIFGAVKLLGYFSRDLYRLAFQFDFALGIFSLACGALILARPERVTAFLPVMTGVAILVDGALKLQTAREARRFGLTHWWSILALGLLACAGGLCLILDPFQGALTLMTLLGAALVADGAQNLLVAAYTVKAFRKSRENDGIIDSL